MKKKFLMFASVGVFSAIVLSSYQTGTHGTLGNRTGSDGNTTGCVSCHGNQNSATTATVILLDGTTPVTAYVPGRTYTLVLGGSNTGTGHSKYGFQLTCATTAGAAAGTLSANGVAGVSARANNTLLEHNMPLSGIVNAGNYIYGAQFQWTAPAAGTGSVKFFTVINGVNANGSSDAGDQWNFGTSSTITEQTGTSVKEMNELSGISLYPNPSAGSVSVHFENAVAGTYQFQLTDMTGRVLQTNEKSFGNGTNVFKANTAALDAGLYLMKVTNGTQEKVMKFYKQ
ncbi:hypothetical protein DBR32_11395 [Taibaiella sp. KBW10]|uniref:T9SS type A sorting domain-containing protein n=1 Tax=Taibaiella sp. KBW10 TaxID=2153357 RepID=UPI000F5A4F1A|nr:choice-of-anchor V domain-containing protein [Taibaiella sp. KBW10]RQO30180.1 hypothetical protein DBR32_11395 [Taibaiella sp. KBW10]